MYHIIITNKTILESGKPHLQIINKTEIVSVCTLSLTFSWPSNPLYEFQFCKNIYLDRFNKLIIYCIYYPHRGGNRYWVCPKASATWTKSESRVNKSWRRNEIAWLVNQHIPSTLWSSLFSFGLEWGSRGTGFGILSFYGYFRSWQPITPASGKWRKRFPTIYCLN